MANQTTLGVVMAANLTTIFLLVVAIIHLLPGAGFASAERIKSLYEIEIADQNLEILMRHRAALFAIIGGLFPYAAFTPSVQPIAFVVAFVSIGSFFYLTIAVGGYSSAIRKIVVADIIASTITPNRCRNLIADKFARALFKIGFDRS